MNRQDFMTFFRDVEKLNTLSTDDRIEIFSSILSGSSDITTELLQGLLRDYGVDDVVVYDKKQLFDRFPILNTETITGTLIGTQIEEQSAPDKLIPNRWYTLKENADSILIFVKDSEDASNNYGFSRDGSWFENSDRGWNYTCNPQDWREATQEEVQKAMINHFKKNYHGNFSKCLHGASNYKAQENYELRWSEVGQCLRYYLEGGVGCVYDDGRWADLITVDRENGEVSYDTDTQKNTKLTKGKWYKNLTHEGSYFLFEEIGNFNYKGCGVDYIGNWYDNDNWVWGLDDSYREATQQEIEEILIKEARSRGYKEGQFIKSFVYGESRLSGNGEGFRFDKKKNRLWYNSNILFQDGKWAEVTGN